MRAQNLKWGKNQKKKKKFCFSLRPEKTLKMLHKKKLFLFFRTASDKGERS